MIIDTHMHESKYSLDSYVSLREIIKKAKEIGLNGICITDHESNEIMEEANAVSKEEKFPIIVGAEFLTYEGDILVFGLNKLPKEKIHAQQLLDIVNSVGGVAIAAHPYRKNNRGLEEKIRTIKGLHGIECFNGSTPLDLNLKAYNDAIYRGVAMFGGSDCHIESKIGKYATRFPDWVKNLDDFIKAVKLKKTSPVMHNGKEYINIENYLKEVI